MRRVLLSLILAGGALQAQAVGQPSTYAGCAQRSVSVPWGGSVRVDLAACQSFGLGTVAQAPAFGRATPGDDVVASYVYTHFGQAPAGGGQDHFVVLDDNSDRIRVQVRIEPAGDAASITPAVLPGLRAGTAVREALALRGGQGPVAFALAGGALPEGLALADDGRLTGIPTRRGPFQFEATARDAGGRQARRAYAGRVEAAPLALQPARLDIVRGQAVDRRLGAQGGLAPHRIALEPGQVLPTGLVLSAEARLQGLTAVPPGEYRVQLRVTDASAGIAPHFELETLALVVRPAAAD